MSERAVIFECGGSPLLGILHAATGRVGIVIVVGGPQYRAGSHRQFTLMAREFAKQGYPTLRFDYRGMGDSDGDYTGFERIGDDIRAAVDALLHEEPRLKGVILWGLCDAVPSIFEYAPGDERVMGVIAANPWARSEATLARAYVRTYYLQRLFQRSFWAKLLGGGVQIGASLGDAVGKVRQSRASAPTSGTFLDRMLNGWRQLSRPVLLLISGRDLTAAEFMDRCKDAKWQAALQRPTVRQESLPTADHTFSAQADLTDATARCVSWIRQIESQADPR